MAPLFFFRVYGLSVAADRPLLGLVPTAPCRNPDLRVVLSAEGPTDCSTASWERLFPKPGSESESTSAVEVSAPLDRSAYLMAFRGGQRFLLAGDGSRIVLCPGPRSEDLDDVLSYLLGSVLSLALQLRGIVCLHASAFELAGRAVAIVGHSGAGKSTTLAAICDRDFRAVSDDLLPISDEGGAACVVSGYPRIRLWPQAASLLGLVPETLPRIVHDWEKRYLELAATDGQFYAGILPLGAVYFLRSEVGTGVELEITQLTDRDALVALLAAVHGNLIGDMVHQAEALRLMGVLTRRVPIRLVTLDRELSAPGAVGAGVLRDLSQLGLRPADVAAGSLD